MLMPYLLKSLIIAAVSAFVPECDTTAENAAFENEIGNTLWFSSCKYIHCTEQWGIIVLNNSGDGRIFNGTFTFPINAAMCYQAIAIQQGGAESKASASVITGIGNNYANVRIEYPTDMVEGGAYVFCVCS